MVNMDEILELVVKKDASDVHLICGNKPVLRIARELTVCLLYTSPSPRD